MNVIFRKTVCTLISAVFGFTQIGFSVARAGDLGGLTPDSSIQSYGKSVNALGKTLGEKYRDAHPSFDGTSINFNAGGNQYSINKNSLVPTEDGSHIKYNAHEADFESQQDLWDNNEKMDDVGSQNKDTLYRDAASEAPSVEGQVYQILVDEAKTLREDLSKEAALQRTQDILDNLKAEIEAVVKCQESNNLATSGEYTHLPDYQYCQQVLDRSQTCVVDHNYSNGAIEYAAGLNMNVDVCKDGTPNCTQMWLGIVGDNYYSGYCAVYEEDLWVRVLNPELIVSATLDYAKWDDYFQVWIGDDNKGGLEKVWWGPDADGKFPPDEPWGYNGCERKTSWSRNPNVDVTRFFTGAQRNDILHFRTRTSVSGGGEGYARIKIVYDPNKVVENEEWTNPDCLSALSAITDGMAVGEVTCTKMPGSVDSEGCAIINGVKACASMLGEPPFDLKKWNIHPLCQQIRVESNFMFYKGDTGCWTALVGWDENGRAQYEQVCGGENAGGNLDTCQPLIDKGCRPVESKCTDGMTGESGTCYVNDVTYDCGHDVKIGNDRLETTYECQGIACAGEDCIDASRTYNSNFAQMSALLQMTENASEDMQCEGLDEEGNMTGEANVTCQVFGGTAGTCKIAVGGWQDCCDNPQSPGLGDFIHMALNLVSAYQNTASFEAGTDYINTSNDDAINSETKTVENAQGQHAQTKGEPGNVLAQGVGYLKKEFSSFFDNIVSHPLETLQGAVMSWIKGAVTNALKELVLKLVAKGVASLLESTGLAVGTAAVEAGNAAANMVAGAFCVAMWIYVAYQVANLIVQMVYKCTEDEYELDSKRDAKSCHEVGTYCSSKKLGICIVKKRAFCCFQSPLARIVNEQIRKTQPEVLGAGGSGGWGSAKDPYCEGVPAAKIDSINWDLIDLSEWMALVADTDNIPSDESDVTQEKLTKDVESTNYNNERKTTNDRTEEKLQDQDVDRLRIEAARCFQMYLGDNQYTGGECVEVSTDKITCRDNGHIVSCDEIAKDNMLDDLLGNTDPNKNHEYATEGKYCYKDGVVVDCTTLYDERLAEEVLNEYAAIIGGSTYKNKYVCQDLSGAYTEHICEQAIKANTCQCEEQVGQFVCRLGSQIIDCAELGIASDAECPSNCTKKDTEGYICEKIAPDAPYDGAFCEEIDAEDTGLTEEENVPDGAYCEEADSGSETPDIPNEGYVCVPPVLDPDNPDNEISDWIIDVEATCTTPGSKHKENLKTGEIVITKAIIKVCTADMEDGAAEENKPK